MATVVSSLCEVSSLGHETAFIILPNSVHVRTKAEEKV